MLAPPATPRPSAFNLFGFPTTVRPGFIAFVALIALLYPFPLGLWVAASVAAFTVLHEFGHAWMARRAGCEASISLDFMVAFATYRPRRELRWGERAAIAFAGPGIQIATALALLAATGTNPFDRDAVAASDFTIAVWWAGLALGVLNLVPLLPLDGGAIVASVVESFAPRSGRLWVLRVSIAITAIVGSAAVSAGFIGLLPLLVIMLSMQWQSLSAPSRLHRALSDPSLTPTGEPQVDSLIIEALSSDGQHRRAIDFARNSYRMCPAASTAVEAARASLAGGSTDDALAWLRVADSSRVDREEVARIIEFVRDLDVLRDHPEASPEWFSRVLPAVTRT